MNDKKREPARWVISREMRECTETIKEGEGEAQKEYFISPLGTKGRRILFCGKITSKTEEGEMTKLVISDSTGAFYVTFFSKDFNQTVKEQIDLVNQDDTVMVLGKTSYYRTDEGRMYININPESIRTVDEDSVNFWMSRSSFLLRRRIIGIKELKKSPESSEKTLISMGFSEDEATAMVQSNSIYETYDVARMEEILLEISAGKVSETTNDLKEKIFDLVKQKSSLGGITYDDIAKEMNIDMQSTQDMDQVLSILLGDGEVFEASRRKYKAV
jgi:hypothetical protein